MSRVVNRFRAVKRIRRLLLITSLALLSQWPASAVQSVLLSWNPSTDGGVAGYRIYSGGASGAYTNVVHAGNGTNVTISGLADGATNYFSATTYDASTNESAYSAEVVFVTPVDGSTSTTNGSLTPATTNQPVVVIALNAVTNLMIAANPTNANSAILSWNASGDSGVAGYKIYSGAASLTYTNMIDAGLATNVTICGLANGSTNYFAVTEYDAATNESPASSEVSFAVPALSVLNIVGNVAAIANPSLANSVILSWNPSTDAGVAGYQVFMGTASGNYATAQNVGLVSSLVVTNLTPGTTNYFAVREFDATWRESDMSPEARWFDPVPVNQPPTLNGLASFTLNMNSTAQTVALTGVSSGSPTENQTLKITAISSNTKLIANPKVTYTSPGTTGILTLKLAANHTGTATITVTVNDGGASNNIITQSFTVTVVNPALLAALPKFSKQLTGARVLPGQPISLSVGVIGRAPFKYQWKFNGTNLSGATAAMLSFKKAKLTQAGIYSVQVSNGVGVTNSVLAQLVVITNTAPSISAPVQGNGQFSFQVTGVPGFKYVVAATSDLNHWTSVQTNTAPFTYTETNAGNYDERFYRSYYQP